MNLVSLEDCSPLRRAFRAVVRGFRIGVPVLVMHSEDDQRVPYSDHGSPTAELLRSGALDRMTTPHADTVNADLLTFIRA